MTTHTVAKEALSVPTRIKKLAFPDGICEFIPQVKDFGSWGSMQTSMLSPIKCKTLEEAQFAIKKFYISRAKFLSQAPVISFIYEEDHHE